jgi:glycosyltransferase involved in cell wall biosynthesis
MVDRVKTFPGRIGIQQRVLPAYRGRFFDALAEACDGGLSIFAGDVHPDESIPTPKELDVARYVHSRNFHFLQVQSPYYFLWQAGLVQWMEDWNPDVLVVEANPRYMSTRGAIRWMHRRGKPVIGWGLGAPLLEGGSSQWGRFIAERRNSQRKKFLDQLDAVISYSHKGAGEYEGILFSSQNIFVAPNAVARRPAGQPPQRSPGYDKRPKVLFVGRIQPRKRIDNLLRACSGLPEAIQPLLWIIGDGPSRREIQTLAGQIYPSAEFPGEMHGSELKKYFSQADLFVLPGTGGLAVQEAMAYGLPVIVAEGDGTQNDLVSSGNGWLITPDDENALTKSLEEALSDPMRLREMGAESFKIVQEEINVEKMVAVFVEAANSVKATMVSHP